MKRFTAALLALVLVFSLALTGCGSTATQVKDITITYVTSPLNVPSIVERNHSILAENMAGVGVENVLYSEITSGADQTQALASGDIQFLYCVGATSVILSAAADADIKIISMYSRSPEAFCMFSNDASIDSPEDLRGKTIAGPQGTILHELLVAYLATADMTLADVNFINTTIPDGAAALANGSVDCALMAGAAAYNTKAAGTHLVTTGEGLVDATIVCATTQQFYNDHKDVVDAFLKGQAAVLEYVSANEEQALQETAEELDLDVEAVREMYGYYDFDMTIKESDIAAMKSTMEFMLETGMIENEVDIEALILK